MSGSVHSLVSQTGAHDPESMLVIVPCGKSKLWDRKPDHGPVAAAEAYTDTPFRLNREYAERSGDAWVALSTKYGFIGGEPQHDRIYLVRTPG